MIGESLRERGTTTSIVDDKSNSFEHDQKIEISLKSEFILISFHLEYNRRV